MNWKNLNIYDALKSIEHGHILPKLRHCFAKVSKNNNDVYSDQ